MVAVKAIAAAVAATAMVVGTAASIKNQKKSVRLQREAQRFERQKNQLQEARQRTNMIKESRAARANVTQSAENQGVADTSAAQGGQGSIQSQVSSNLSFLDQYGMLSDQASSKMNSAMGAQGNASMWGAIAGAGGQVFSAVGGFGAFSGPTPPTAAAVAPKAG